MVPSWLGRLGRKVVPGSRETAALPSVALKLSPRTPLEGSALASLLGLRERGFVEAGAFAVAGRGDLAVALLVKPDEAMAAAVFQPAGAAPWIELVSHYGDGEILTFSAGARAIESSPGRVWVHAPRFQPGALYARFRAERRRDLLVAIDADSVVELFESR
jgi:hypothetical protein